MMNVLALGLVLTSLLTAGFFTPSPENQKSMQDVIVKEGHRVVVVEYEKDDGNTKVSISPQDSEIAHKVDDKISERMENLKETVKEEDIHHGFSPKELVCDAYGKCKEKIASAMGRTTEAAAGAGETAEATVEGAKETVNEAIGKVKDTVTHTAHKASDIVQEKKENLKDSASEISRKSKEKVTEKAIGVKREGEKELSEILRRVYEVGADVLNYVFSHERVNSLAGILHLMGFAAAYGMCVWVTFALSYVLAGALPRHQFAMVQSKIYPLYFKAMAYSVGMAILGQWASEGKRFSMSNVGMFRGFELMAALVMILVNLAWLEPKANKVLLERMKKEKEEGKVTEVINPIAETAGRGSTGGTTTTPGATQEKPEAEAEAEAARSQIIQLNATLQRLNSYSSFLNVLTLASLTWHLGHLAQRLHTKC